LWLLLQGVAVHCYWGRGRTGTMLAAYLVAVNEMYPDEAIDHIRRLRPFSIETDEQEEAVHNFSAHVRAWALQDKEGHSSCDSCRDEIRSNYHGVLKDTVDK